MDRRSALKYLGAASATALIFPSCVGDAKKLSVALNNLQITGEDEELLASIAAALIPATDTPGAREVGAHLFTFVMVDDCLPPDERELYMKGMRSFPDEVKALTSMSFLKTAAEKRASLLAGIDEKQSELSDGAKKFYKISRNWIIQGYTTSQHYLTHVAKYQLIPGPVFNGCKPIAETEKSIS